MWVRRAAIRPVPAYARVPLRALAEVENQLAEDDPESRTKLNQAFARFEETQPALAAHISDLLSGPLDDTALALGYFLTLSIWLAFDAVFAKDLVQVTPIALRGAEEALALDEQIRSSDPAEAVDSDEVIAMEQPDVMAFIHEHLDAALDTNADDVDVSDVHAVYRMVLVELLALSYAVTPPSNWNATLPEYSA